MVFLYEIPHTLCSDILGQLSFTNGPSAPGKETFIKEVTSKCFHSTTHWREMSKASGQKQTKVKKYVDFIFLKKTWSEYTGNGG